MTSQYDRVSYPDKVQFASELEDEHDGVGHQTGNGIYNDYTVQITPKPYTESFKIACFRIEKTKRSAFIICGILVIVVLVIIVAATVHGHIQAQKGKNQLKTKGLIAYPQLEDGSTVISFDPTDYSSYGKYFENIQHQMKDYETMRQKSQPDTYVVCAKNRTSESLPDGKFCMQIQTTFDDFCNQGNLYGYITEQPCILLVLKLDEGVKPEPYDVSAITDQALKTKFSQLIQNVTIPVVCDGKTEADRQNMMVTDIASGTTKTEILYNPQGYPLYRFPAKGDSRYINPAVMVHFKSLKMDADVTVRCTAWVKDGDRSPQEEGSIYSTEFTFKIYHKPAG